jgi:NADH dehydrogenase
MPEDLGERARRVLEKMGVEIRQNVCVTDVTDGGVQIGDEFIAAENVFWAAGVQGQEWVKSLGVELDGCGRIFVGPDMAIPGHKNVFVVGDAAHAIDAKTGKPVPGLAQGAIQTGNFVAAIIRRELDGTNGRQRPAFRYHDKGSMAIIGRGNAIAAIGKRHFGGFFGWLTWCFVHVMFLVGFGNKLLVMADWFWNFVRHKRGARLITGDPEVHVKRLRA